MQDLLDLSLKDPKRYDTYMASKVECNGNKGFIINLQDVNLIGIKNDRHISYLRIKGTMETIQYISNIEERVKQIVKENCSRWFKTRMYAAAIDDYFQSCVVFDNKNRTSIRFLLDDIEDDNILDTTVTTVCDITIVLKSIKFYKNYFQLFFGIKSISPKREKVLFQDDVVSDGEAKEIDEDFGPSGQDLEEIRQSLLKKVGGSLIKVRGGIAELARIQDELVALQTALGSSDGDDVQGLDYIDNKLTALVSNIFFN